MTDYWRIERVRETSVFNEIVWLAVLLHAWPIYIQSADSVEQITFKAI